MASSQDISERSSVLGRSEHDARTRCEGSVLSYRRLPTGNAVVPRREKRFCARRSRKILCIGSQRNNMRPQRTNIAVTTGASAQSEKNVVRENKKIQKKKYYLLQIEREYVQNFIMHHCNIMYPSCDTIYTGVMLNVEITRTNLLLFLCFPQCCLIVY